MLPVVDPLLLSFVVLAHTYLVMQLLAQKALFRMLLVIRLLVRLTVLFRISVNEITIAPTPMDTIVAKTVGSYILAYPRPVGTARRSPCHWEVIMESYGAESTPCCGVSSLVVVFAAESTPCCGVSSVVVVFAAPTSVRNARSRFCRNEPLAIL